MWFYSQKTGVMRRDDEIVGSCYSGNDLKGGQCKNNPEAQAVHNHGPLPRGTYQMGTPKGDGRLGPYIIPLWPQIDNRMFGRNGFFVHGDNPSHPGQSSDGCIVADLAVRMRMWSSGDHLIEVTE